MTANQFFKSYYLPDQEHRMRPSTVTTRRSSIKCYFLSAYGDDELDCISTQNIDDLLDDLMLDYAHNTVFGAYVAIRSFFFLASHLGYISENPAENIRSIQMDL